MWKNIWGECSYEQNFYYKLKMNNKFEWIIEFPMLTNLMKITPNATIYS